MRHAFRIAYQYHIHMTPLLQMRLAKAAGFDETELCFHADSPRDICRACERADVRVASARLPLEGVNLLWHAEAEDWQTLLALYRSYFALAEEYGISSLILLPSVGTAPPAVSQMGLDRFRCLANEAENMGVRLAISNESSYGHFDAVARCVCRGFHGVSFDTSPRYAISGREVLPCYVRRKVTETVINAEGYVDVLEPLSHCLTEDHFQGSLVYRGMLGTELYEKFAARGYDTLLSFDRMLRDAEGVV